MSPACTGSFSTCSWYKSQQNSVSLKDTSKELFSRLVGAIRNHVLIVSVLGHQNLVTVINWLGHRKEYVGVLLMGWASKHYSKLQNGWAIKKWTWLFVRWANMRVNSLVCWPNKLPTIRCQRWIPIVPMGKRYLAIEFSSFFLLFHNVGPSNIELLAQSNTFEVMFTGICLF